MTRPDASTPKVNGRYRRNFWATNVRYPTTADKAQIWLAMQDAMRLPSTAPGGER